MAENKAKRYNKGKIRYGLIPPFAKKAVADVYTKGAHKYSVYKDRNGKLIHGYDIPIETVGEYELVDDASDNWRKGLSWRGAMESVERHIEAWKHGEDTDGELKTLHLANATWGLLTLLEYYKIYPQGDDRPHHYLTAPKIGLDIDEVLVDWLGAYKEYYGYKSEHEFNSWYLHYDIVERCTKDLGNDFYSKLKPKIKPTDLPFEPHCYITSRNIPTEVTKKWLYDNGFPCMPVYTIGLTDSKADIAKKAGIDIFVDDVYKNFVELNRAGICCYLFDAPHNRRYNVGHKRIYSLNDLVSKV